MAKLPFVVVGDGTTGGGKVIGGSPGSTIEGKPIARVGDMATCPINGHGGASPIITGDGTCLIDGRPAARHNDSLACGCKLVASQGNVTTGDAGGSSSRSSSTSSHAESQTRLVDGHDEQIRAVDHETNEPIPNLAYFIESPDGKTYAGRTNAKGLCERVETVSPEELHVWFGDEAEQKMKAM